MSTFIKVEQSGSNLLRRNIEQTQANRLAKVEGDEQARTGKQAQDQRRQALAERGLDPQGNALAGSRRRDLRKDEPAAVSLQGGLIISWAGTQPILADRRPALTITQKLNVAPAVIGSVQAVTGSADPTFYSGQYDIGMYRTGLSDFTLEFYGQFSATGNINDPSGRGSLTGVSVSWRDTERRIFSVFAQDDNNGKNRQFLIRGNLPSTDNTSILSTLPDADPLVPYHVCLQRVNMVYSYYFNGALKNRVYGEMIEHNLSQNMELFFSYSTRHSPVENSKLGEVRYTPNRARYPEAGFTPDPLPFRP